jgi:ABC-type Fe3+/spermidine/putrescine transport system ATPase subunit
VLVNGSEHTADTAGVSGDCTVLVRPERVLLSPLGTGQPEAVPAVVEQRVYIGAVTQVLMRLGEHKLQALIANDGSPMCGEEGETVDAYFPPNAIRVLTS